MRGIYCYFATVDANHNSAYPYVVGPTFYGNVVASKVSSITETVTTYTVLPINLMNFQGKIEQKNAVLDWTTASESNNSHYIIERSTDGLHFSEVGKVQSKGNHNQKMTYTFVDQNAPEGKLYYRLKQVDIDGKSETFKVISLQNTYAGFGFKVFPNPASEMIVIQTDDILRSDVHVALVNTLGATVVEKDFLAGSSNCFLDTQTLYNGLYQLVITENGVAKTQKIVIQK
jgi:Secretion system C-terminal sorting domain